MRKRRNRGIINERVGARNEVEMKTSIQTLGDGLGVSLPPAVLRARGLSEGSEVEILACNEGIILIPVGKGKSRLEDLVSQITDNNMHELVDWGPPVGGEVW